VVVAVAIHLEGSNNIRVVADSDNNNSTKEKETHHI
jgi:hypothetical protein